MKKLTSQEILAHISKNRDVGYYNKEIIENNKEITKYKGDPSSSLGLVANATEVTKEVPLPDPLLEEGQRGEEEDLSSSETLPPPLITELAIHRAIIQLHVNENSRVKHKLKVRLNADFGQGIENIDFICALTKDLGNFKKYSPEQSREFIHTWVDDIRQRCRELGIKPYMGKFHSNQGWQQGGERTNEKEPWCAAVLWYEPLRRQYVAAVRIYQWEWYGDLGKDSISDKQVSVRAQTLWVNPLHKPKIERPKTWAEQRWGKK